MKNDGFVGQRAQLYIEAQSEFPFVRREELLLNLSYLKPQSGEKILEVGAGTGYYTQALAESVAPSGLLIATDPSSDQLKHISRHPNLRMIRSSAEQLHQQKRLFNDWETFDAIWSHASFHHCFNKSQAFRNFFQLLKKGGRLLICDVLSGTPFAEYFDQEVARRSISGHEVSFLTKGFFESLCHLHGFKQPRFYDVVFRWKFRTLEDLGCFMIKIHGLSQITPIQCYQQVSSFLSVEQNDEFYTLFVPHTIFETNKNES